MKERLHVEEPARLLDFLRERLTGWRRKTLEQRIRSGCVRVNGEAVDRNVSLAAGDEVLVADAEEGGRRKPPPPGIVILHEDEHLLAIDKPVGMLSVETDAGTGRSALALLRDHLTRPGRPHRLWPVHRIDRETSGVLLFAKTMEARNRVQKAWAEAEKTYWALVEGHPDPPAGSIEQPLWEDPGLNVRVGTRPGAKMARTRYATLRTIGKRALLEVQLDTGRRHQIRAHLAWLGHPVVGDPRYGKPAARMGLHALRLVVPHPADGRRLTIEAKPPKAFNALINTNKQ